MRKFLVIFWTIIAFIVIVAVQKNVLEQIPLFGICPNIGTVLVCAIAIISGTQVGGVFGFFYGFIMDISYGRTLGINTLIFLLIGIVSGLLNNKMSKDSKISLEVFVLASTIVLEVVTAGFMTLFYDVDIPFLYFARMILIEILYNLFLSFVFYRTFTAWGEQLNKIKKSYYVLN